MLAYYCIALCSLVGPVLCCNVYMPTDYGTMESFVEYAHVCSKLSVLFDDSDATTLLVASDIHVKELKLTQFKNNPQNGPAKEEQTDTAGHRNAWCSTSYFNEM